MFTSVPQPLAYAEALLAQFSRLSRTPDIAGLLEGFVRAAAELSQCDLAQVYRLDTRRTTLAVHAEHWPTAYSPTPRIGAAADHIRERLLQFAMSRNRVVCLDDLDRSVHDVGFLPNSGRAWRSLLLVPLVNQQETVDGLLLCASHSHRDLQCFADSLGRLGSFVLGHAHLLTRVLAPRSQLSRPPIVSGSARHHGLRGRSLAMRGVYSLIDKVSPSTYTVLLGGETGTGKEVVARAIHDCGPRRSQPFIVQNCAALPEHLLESELFGYRKGAFTGADRDRPGLFDAANGGTLLLDEVGDMPLTLQAKLLRVLQECEIRPLGSNDTHRIDVRIIAATHRDLAALIREGRFREDLYYRLAQFPIELPALRQRGDDILDLARHFADQACTFLQRDEVIWSPDVLDLLASYPFPGNVRELKCLVERAVLLCEGSELQVEHFPVRSGVAVAPQVFTLRERLEQIERSLLIDCLRKNDGNQTLSARELGLPRRTFLYRLGRLNIDVGAVHGQA